MPFLWGDKVCVCGFAEVLGPQITEKNLGSANRKSTMYHICGRSENPTTYLSPQSCGFAIWGTFFRTAHFGLFYIVVNPHWGFTIILRIAPFFLIAVALRFAKNPPSAGCSSRFEPEIYLAGRRINNSSTKRPLLATVYSTVHMQTNAGRDCF